MLTGSQGPLPISRRKAAHLAQNSRHGALQGTTVDSQRKGDASDSSVDSLNIAEIGDGGGDGGGLSKFRFRENRRLLW